MVDLVVIVLALKLAEGTGGLEFDGWGGAFGAAVVCWMGGWVSGNLLLLAMPTFPGPEITQSLSRALSVSLGLQLFTTLFSLLIAWAVVPGTHIRRVSGLILASILVVAFTYAASLLMSQVAA